MKKMLFKAPNSYLLIVYQLICAMNSLGTQKCIYGWMSYKTNSKQRQWVSLSSKCQKAEFLILQCIYRPPAYLQVLFGLMQKVRLTKTCCFLIMYFSLLIWICSKKKKVTFNISKVMFNLCENSNFFFLFFFLFHVILLLLSCFVLMRTIRKISALTEVWFI